MTGQKISEEDLKKYDVLDDNLAMMLSVQIDRQVTNARKFLQFHVHDSGKHRQMFLPTGWMNTGDVLSTLIEQTVLLLKHNQHFTSLSLPDQIELMEANAMVAAVISCCPLYNPQSRNLTWPLAEQDFKYFKTLNMAASSRQASFQLSDVLTRVESDLRDTLTHLFNFFDSFSKVGVHKAAINILILVSIFNHDICDLEDKKIVHDHRLHYLLLLFECLCQSEGVSGACNIASKLNRGMQDLDRICQLLGQKMVQA